MQRQIILIIIAVVAANVGYSQLDTVGNSLAGYYSQYRKDLQYSYDHEKQVHNYSGNWDLDNDGKTDGLFFVGTGGAHLYYYLRIVLSSTNQQSDLTYILSDYPVLDENLPHEAKPASLKMLRNFDVGDFNADGLIDIFVGLDEASFKVSRDRLKKMGIRSQFLLISVSNGKLIFTDHGK